MRTQFWIQEAEYNKFLSQCSAVIQNVHAGTKAATEFACAEIMSESLSQVPIDTGTLASTAYYNVIRRTDISGYRYEGVLGYAGHARTHINGIRSPDAINPKSGKKASYYAAIVHEDLTMMHSQGKAKFLEDPIRAYGQANFKRVAEQYWRNALSTQMIARTYRGGTVRFKPASSIKHQQKVRYSNNQGRVRDMWHDAQGIKGTISKNTFKASGFTKSNNGNYYPR